MTFADAIAKAQQRGREQRQLTFDFIERHIAEHGWAPSVREIAEALDVNVSTAHLHLRGLVEEGRIISGGGPRMIRVVAGGSIRVT